MRRFLRPGHDPVRERLKRDLFQFNKVWSFPSRQIYPEPLHPAKGGINSLSVGGKVKFRRGGGLFSFSVLSFSPLMCLSSFLPAPGHVLNSVCPFLRGRILWCCWVALAERTDLHSSFFILWVVCHLFCCVLGLFLLQVVLVYFHKLFSKDTHKPRLKPEFFFPKYTLDLQVYPCF